MAPHPGGRNSTGHWDLRSALCHLPVVAQEGNASEGQSGVAAPSTSFFDPLSPGDVYAVALGLNPDFVREFLCDRNSHTASRSLFLHLGHHHNSTTLEYLCT